MAESNSAGALAVRHDQDAFGIKQTDWAAGTPSPSTAPGWHHNTKHTDPDTGLVYMYQRWYNPETGTFLSKAPYPVHVEHAYGFAYGDPVVNTDPNGENPAAIIIGGAIVIGAIYCLIYPESCLPGRNDGNGDDSTPPCPAPTDECVLVWENTGQTFKIPDHLRTPSECKEWIENESLFYHVSQALADALEAQCVKCVNSR